MLNIISFIAFAITLTIAAWGFLTLIAGDNSPYVKTEIALPAEEGPSQREKDQMLATLMEHGEQVYTNQCTVCHQTTGIGFPPNFPALNGSAVATGPIEEQIDLLLNGRRNTAMVSFAALDNWQLAAVITYTRNAWDNEAGDMVQPEQINAQRSNSW
ncbi:MAG: cytochrome c [Pseudomonadota bacterium]